MLTIQRGVNSEDYDKICGKKRIKKSKNKSSSSDDENVTKDNFFKEKFKFKEQECEYLTLIREGFEYAAQKAFGNRILKGHQVQNYK